MKIKKTILKIAILTGLAFLLLNYFQPALVQSFIKTSFPALSLSKNVRVFGAKDQKRLEQIGQSAIKFIGSLPVVQEFSRKLNDRLNTELDKAKKLPQQKTDELKDELRETVCDEILK